MGTCVLCQDNFGGARGVVQLRNCECVCLLARLYVRTFGRLDVFMSGRLYVCTFVFVYTSGCLDILHLSTFARVSRRLLRAAAAPASSDSEAP